MPSQFRIHPAIGIARVGNSSEFNLAPESLTGLDQPGQGAVLGGLPLKAGTEDEHITSSDLRDDGGRLRRQAARFRIFAYPEPTATWPSGEGAEITLGSEVDGKVVADIVWSVHVANKKANWFVLVEDGEHQGIASYSDGRLPPLRNAMYPKPGHRQPADKLAVLNHPDRVRALTIDPGPRTVHGADSGPVAFDAATPASYRAPGAAETRELADYATSFPADTFPDLVATAGPIDTLGELRTDADGRLIFAGGYGKAAGWRVAGAAPPLDDDVNNDQWFDDSCDGPVEATLVFTDGSVQAVHGAWVTATDPGFAPQVLNIVSLWDDLYDVWVRELGLSPEIFRPETGYDASYQPSFDDQVHPIFRAASLAQWTTNLNPAAQSAHAQLDTITAATDPWSTPVSGLAAIFRDPDKDQYQNTTLMPLALGDASESMLALRRTQYFFLQQWNAGTYSSDPAPALGHGELLDKASLMNCLGGRFSPGIDMTFVTREPEVYVRDWSDGGPFRVRRKELDYGAATTGAPLLTGGFVPRHVTDGVEPGDLSKFMALPWHTDYNSCSTHPPSPNPKGNRLLFWSWPAQRPVAVFSADDLLVVVDTVDDPGTHKRTLELGPQRWSVRGAGTDSDLPENWGRYQEPISQMLDNWHRIGTVMQAPTIDGLPGTPQPRWLLEAGSQLIDTDLTPVEPFPNLSSTPNPDDPSSPPDERQLFYRLLNYDEDAGLLAQARQYTDYWLAWAQRLSDDPTAVVDQRFFPYSKQALQDRLDFIYQELVDAADASDPSGDPVFRTRADMITRITQMAPLNLMDGAWLRNIGQAGPMDEVRSLLFSVLMDELGDGDISKNHCNIYLDLCHSVGYYPPPVNSAEFAFDPQLLQSAFTVPAFELAISQFSQEYFPELLGMTLQLEWEVVDLKPTRDLLDHFGIDSHFYVMHIGIDNSVNGHGARAVEAVDIYLENVRATGGDDAVQQAWRRIWNGFVAFGTIGTLGQDMQDLLTTPPTLREQVLQMIAAKAEYGSLNHQWHTVGDTAINEWFADPAGFLDALVAHDYLTPGDWPNSRLNQLLDFETGPMYRVFTDDEIALWASYTASLAAPPAPPKPRRKPAARAMADLVDELRPVQAGNPAHQENFLADADGMARSVHWWFGRPTSELMSALADRRNEMVTPGVPAASEFVNLISPTGPMGSVFALESVSNPGELRIQVVHRWIAEGCPMLAAAHTSLRLNTPSAVVKGHRTGQILGMGAVH